MAPIILFVDDHLDDAEMIALLLRSTGYCVVTVETASETLVRAQDTVFDLYLLADKNGIELCQQIRAFDTTTPILIFSAYANQNQKRAALVAGAQDCVTQTDFDGLANKIADCILMTQTY